jgi:hypothetical protein
MLMMYRMVRYRLKEEIEGAVPRPCRIDTKKIDRKSPL